jgi:metallophosphoesterase superfamily enzyme
MDWHIKAEELKFDQNLSWSELYKELPDINPSAIRAYIRRCSRYKGSEKPVGVIGDLHIPFEHKGYLPFLKDTFRKHHVGEIVSIGDLFDQYSYSRFIKKPISMNPREETKISKERIQKYIKAFPKLKVCLGNHDTRYIDRAEEFGIDSDILQGFRDIYGLPDTWEIYDEYDNYLIMDDVLYIHGSAYNGEKGAKIASMTEQMSVVMGHAHSFAGYWPIVNKRKIMFGLNVGCGISPHEYAFAYNKKDKLRPILGCGIVYNSGYAQFIPMGEKYWS